MLTDVIAIASNWLVGMLTDVIAIASNWLVGMLTDVIAIAGEVIDFMYWLSTCNYERVIEYPWSHRLLVMINSKPESVVRGARLLTVERWRTDTLILLLTFMVCDCIMLCWNKLYDTSYAWLIVWYSNQVGIYCSCFPRSLPSIRDRSTGNCRSLVGSR